jgi:predicted nucleic acid-binding protein
VTWLLDVNVLIAPIDPAHIGHEAPHRWFQATKATPNNNRVTRFTIFSS